MACHAVLGKVFGHSRTLTWPQVVLGCPALAAYGLLLRVVCGSSCRSNQNATALHTPPASIVNVSCCFAGWKELSGSGVLKSKAKTGWGPARGFQLLAEWCAACPAVGPALLGVSGQLSLAVVLGWGLMLLAVAAVLRSASK
jgi:hypothetical protein